MEIRLAKTAGFCFGVNRAVELTYNLLDEGHKVATLGPLIHNPQAVADMERRGAMVADTVDDIPAGYEVIIRSHGVPRSIYDTLEQRALVYHDATCPFVKKIQNIAARAEEYGVPLEGRMFAVSVIDAPSQPLSTVAVEEIIDEATKEDRSIIPFQYENQIVMIFSSDMQDSFSPLFAKQIYRSLSLLQSRIIHYFSRSFNMGIGEIVHEPTSLPESYRSALEALNYTQIYPDQHIISIGDVETIENDHIDSAGELRSELVLAIKFGNSEDTEKAIHAFFQGIAETPNVQNTVINILSIISEICSSYGRNVATLLGDEDLFLALSHANSLSRSESLMTKLAKRANEMASGVRENSHIQFVENAKKIIRERYGDPVFGLEQLTDEISVSPAYFSTTFKKETGASFVQYLTNVRLEKAKELLKSSDAKTYEIAEMTGFSEPNYFSFIFKKNIGVSPSQYRASHR